MGYSAGFTYDRNGNITSQTNALDQTTHFTYDANSNRLTGFKDARGNNVLYSYDSRGNLKQITYEDGTTDKYVYNADGLLTKSINRRGQEIAYEYNDNYQLTKEIHSDGSTVEYEHRGINDLVSFISSNDRNETAKIEYNQADNKLIVRNSNRFIYIYTFDELDRKTQVSIQDGANIYTTKYSYDNFGRLDRLTDGSENIIVDYDYYAVSGQLAKETNGNGTATTYSYDLAGQLISLVNSKSDGSVNSRFDYTYDNLGRRIEVATSDGTWSYEYDLAGQLTGAVFASTNPEIDNQDLTYTYDAAGNRSQTIVNGVTENYSTNNLNQYESAGTTTYSYDLDGNLTSKTKGNQTWTYSYNDDNRLVEVVDSGNNITQYEYDTFGNRTATVYNGQRTEYLIDPFGYGNVIAEYDGDGNLIARYDHGIGLVSRTDASNNQTFYDFDGIGSTAALTGHAGNELNSYNYRPFGEDFYEVETVDNSFEYVGQWGVMEEANGLDFMRARFYDSHSGRFVSSDPIGLQGQDTNFYRYVNNDPLSYVDPEGTTPLTLGAFGAGAAAGFGTSIVFKSSAPAKALGGVFLSASVGINELPAGPIISLPFRLVGAGLLFGGFTADLFGFTNGNLMLPAPPPHSGGNPSGDNPGGGNPGGGDPGGGDPGGGDPGGGDPGGGDPGGGNPGGGNPGGGNPGGGNPGGGNPGGGDPGGGNPGGGDPGGGNPGGGNPGGGNPGGGNPGGGNPGGGNPGGGNPGGGNPGGGNPGGGNPGGGNPGGGSSYSDDANDGFDDAEDIVITGSPLVLDLDGDGIELTAVGTTNVFFDVDNDGFRESVGWVQSDDGLLVFDRNNDGYINDNSELFGNFTTSGFVELREIDSNGDGFITAADNNFSDLQIWRDLDTDGRSDTNELYSLDELNITRISAVADDVYILNVGNEIKETTFYELGDGTTREIVDAWFTIDQLNSYYDHYSTYNEPVVMTKQILNLPNLKGYGRLPDLRIAMAKDPELVNLVQSFSDKITSGDVAAGREMVTSILYRWAGVDGIDPATRGKVDAQKLRFLEKFIGRNWGNRDDNNLGNPGGIAQFAAVNRTFDELFPELEIRLLVQAADSTVDYNTVSETYVFDLGLTEALEQLNEILPQTATPLPQMDLLQAIVLIQFIRQQGVEDKNWVLGKTGDDQLVGNETNELIFGFSGNDSLKGDAGKDTLDGGAGNDTLEGGKDHDLSHGGDGNDLLYDGNFYTQSGQDTLDGGKGNDTLKGMGDDDLYLFNKGYGHDVIEDYHTYSLPFAGLQIDDGGEDTLRFGSGITRNNLRWNFDGKNLTFTLTNSPNDSLTVSNYVDTRYRLEKIEIDNTLLTAEEILNSKINRDTGKNNSLTWLETHISFQGLDGDDTITTGIGNDKLWGNYGDDIINSGTGSDTLLGNVGNDMLNGGAGDDILDGGSGNDTLEGGKDHDFYYGGDGNDLLYDGNYYTQSGQDTLDGGIGNDTLQGMGDDDLYLFDKGYGHDLIDDYHTYSLRFAGLQIGDGGNDTLRFGSGITRNNLRWNFDGKDLTFALANSPSDRLTISNYIDTRYRIENIEVAGTKLSTAEILNTYFGRDTQGRNSLKWLESAISYKGLDGDDTITTGDYEDRLWGDNGNDQLKTSGGNDTIDGGAGNDTLEGGKDHDLYYGGDGNDLLYDGDYYAQSGRDTLDGGIGNDTLQGMGDDDLYLFDKGYGHDLIEDYHTYSLRFAGLQIGDGGNDTLRFGSGITRNNLRWNFDGKDLTFALANSTSDRLTISNYIDTRYRIENIEVAGTKLSTAEILNTYSGRDTQGRNSIKWLESAISYKGLDGDDTITTGSGNDRLWGNEGNDLISSGNGDDVLVGNAGNDTLDGGAGSDRLYVVTDNQITLNDIQAKGEGTDQIRNIEFANLYGKNGDNLIDARGASKIKTIIKGYDGNDTLRGGQNNDTIEGGNGNDTLVGVGGDDIIDGGAGSDRLYVVTDNQITLNDTQAKGEGTDQIRNIELANLYGKNDDNLIDARGATKIKTIIKGNDGNDTLRGGQNNDTIEGGNGNDTLVGVGGDDIIDGGAGSDRLYVVTDNQITLSDTQATGDGTDEIRNIEFANLYGKNGDNLIDARGATKIQTIIKGYDGNDTLMGSQLSDNIQGGNGNDLLYGGAGDDILTGNGGADIFVLESTAGTDTITDFRDGVDTFGLINLGFNDLSITNNQAETATIVADMNNQILVIVNNISAADITATDFINV